MKSADYVGAVVSAYRRVIDGLSGDREKSLREGRDILKGDFARKKTLFYFDDIASGSIDWLKADQDGGTGIPLGTLLKVKGSGDNRRGLIPAEPAAGPAPRPGDSIRLHRHDDTERKAHKLNAVEEADDAAIWISIPEGFGPGDSVYLIQTRRTTRRYPPVIRGAEGFKREPGREKAPEINLPPLKKREKPLFPEGIYAEVSRTEDLFILQSIRPTRVMLHLTRKNAARLLDKPPLPFTSQELILVLDPYLPQAIETTLEEEISALKEKGYHQFVVNNLGHLPYFRNAPQKFAKPSEPARQAALIAGPYLYQFNRWASAFIASLGIDAMISPLENNRQNLEKTIPPGRRTFTFITLFSYPALFRIRANLKKLYDFEEFRDSREDRFRLISGDGSQVIPEKPFSIVDKAPFLKEAGFHRFILDFSGPPLRKKDYRNIMNALHTGRPLENTSRFNWKDGFYSAEA
jgi:putative protease